MGTTAPEMESNGKSVDSAGDPVNGYTAPVIFGEPGSNAQHSFFQHLHQSPIITPITFMAPLRPLVADASMAADLVADHHDALVIQMLAQDALALGSNMVFPEAAHQPRSHGFRCHHIPWVGCLPCLNMSQPCPIIMGSQQF